MNIRTKNKIKAEQIGQRRDRQRKEKMPLKLLAKITLTLLKNPFNTAGREIKHLEYIPDKTIEQIAQPYIMGLDDFIYSANGKKVEAGYLPMPGDYIAVCPVVGKSKWLGSILSLGLAIWTGGMSSAWIKGGMSAFTAGLLSTAVMYVGGQIINALCPVSTPDYDSSGSATTYSWGDLSARTTQGGALAKTYGTMKTAGTELAKHITTDGDKQYLNVLLCGGQGPIDSISDIRINDNPIANYTGVIVETRLGTNDQTVISNFSDTFDDQALSYELQEASWSTQLTEGNAGEGLEITVEFPNGLYHINKKTGNLNTASVTLAAEYRPEGGEWVSWLGGAHIASTSIAGATCHSTAPAETWSIIIAKLSDESENDRICVLIGSVSDEETFNYNSSEPYAFDNGKIKFTTPTSKGRYSIVVSRNSEISAAQNTAVRRSFRIDNIPAARYEVRMKVTSRSAVTTSTTDSVRVYWTQLSHISYDDFCRPGKVLVGIKALATDQLSGSDITVTWKQSVEYVNVWNPTTSQYDQKSARNMAWVCYDMLHGCRKITNIHTSLDEYVVYNVPVSRIDYQAFANWAAHIDALGLKFEHIFDSATDLWTAFKIPETFGRGKVIMKGTKFSCVFDAPSTPVQLFNVGNILQDSFSKEYLSLTDRANAIEITFINKDKEYETDAITVYGDDYNTDGTVKNPTQITLDGCTTYAQAYQHGMYQLRLNKYLLRTVTWDAEIDAIACQLGDQVLIQHNLPEWGYGGRVVSATATALTIDNPVPMEVGKTYGIYVRLQDDTIVDKTVVNVGAETNVLTVNEAFDVIPQQYDIFAFGEITKKAKPFVVVDVERKDDLTRTLTGIEYVAAVYEESLDAPVIDYSSSENGLSNVVSLSLAEESYKTTEGTSVSLINASWALEQGKSAERFLLWYSDDNANWKFWESTYDMKSTISGIIPGKTYYVKIYASDGVKQSSGTVKSITVVGNTDSPSVVTNITFEEHSRDAGNGVVVIDLQVSFTTPDYEFYKYCDAYMKSNNPAADEIMEITDSMLSTPYEDLATVQQGWKFFGNPINTFTIQNVVQGYKYSFKLVSVAKGDIKADFDTSPVATYTVGGKSYAPFKPSGFAIAITETATLTWDAATQTDVDFTEARTDTNVGNDANKLIKTTANKAIVTLPTRSGKVYLYHHNTAGKYSDAVWAEYNKPAPAAPNVVITDILQGMVITCDALPTYCLGVNFYIDDVVYFSQNNSYTFKSTGGIYNIQVAYVDLFGEGARSAVITKTVSIYIDPDLIEAGSLSLAKMDPTITDAVIKAQASASQLSVDQVNAALVTAQTDIDNAEIAIASTQATLATAQADINNAEARLDTVEGTVTTQSASITTLSNQVALKANQTDLNAATGRITTAESALVTQAGQIALKSNQTTVDTLTGRVTSAEGSITTQAGQIALKSDKAAVDTLTGRVSTAEATLVVQAGEISTKASATSVSAIDTRLTANETATTQNATAITLKASTATVDTLAGRVTTAEGNITTQSGQIALKANQTVVDTLASTVTSNKSAIELTVSGISNTVSTNKTTQDGVNSGFVTQITQNANSIITVAADLASANTVIAQNTSAIQLRATSANLISLINVCPETITLKSSLIYIDANTTIANNVIANGMIKANAVTADKMQIGSTTGERIDIVTNLIRVYDINNVLRVRLGVFKNDTRVAMF